MGEERLAEAGIGLDYGVVKVIGYSALYSLSGDGQFRGGCFSVSSPIYRIPEVA